MKKQKALFLDRDGVINIDHGYVSKIDNFVFTEGIFELLQLFIHKGYMLFIITNQSGIGRGYYSLEDFQVLTQYMLDIFKEKNIHIQEVQYCPHAPEENCDCRKPKTGMIDNILKKHPIDLENSWLIGDKQSDIDLALNSHISHSIAISNTPLHHASYSFDSIQSCKDFIETDPTVVL